MKSKWFVLIAAVLSAGLLGCPSKETPSGATGTGGTGGGTGASAATSTTGDILVGEFGSLTGAQATFGTSTHQGILLALDEINAAGGANGRKIKVITEDDQSKQEEAANAVSKLISQNGVAAVLGEVASSCSLAAAPICQRNKIPMITPSSTNEQVTKTGDYIFRVCFTDNYQGESQATFANQWCEQNHKPKNVAILTDSKSDYSTGLTKVFTDKFQSLGGKVIITQSYANGDSDFKAQLTAVKATNPSLLFVPGYYTDIGQIAIQRADLGMSAVPMLGGDGWESPKLIEIGGKALEGCFYTNHYFADDPAPVVHDFVTRYQKKWGAKPDSLAALAYDAMKVLADSLKRSGGKGGADLRDAIGATKGFVGVTGTITLGPDRNAVGKTLVIEEIKNGQLTLKTTIQAH
jgi:branched-chain amino acid transport system substrate-binding protein